MNEDETMVNNNTTLNKSNSKGVLERRGTMFSSTARLSLLKAKHEIKDKIRESMDKE
jgi:hypothetical protein